MTCQKVIRRFFALAVFWGLLISSMSACQQYRENGIFTFFFPEEEAAETAESGRQVPDEVSAAEEKIADLEQDYLLVTHKPYIQRKCVECHEGASAFTTPIFGFDWDGIFRKGGGMPGPLSLPVKELCLKCHKDLTVDWAKKRGLHLHKTAADGECVKCHVPHQGRHPYRLIVAQDQLCFYKCHNANDKTGIPKCVKELQVTGPCLSCHNAHLGISKALLTKDYEEQEHTVSPEQGGTRENPAPSDDLIPE